MIYQICGNYAYFLIFVIILKGLQSPHIYNLWKLALRGYLNTDARTRESNSERFDHKNMNMNME